MSPEYLTKAGYNKFQKELDMLRGERRKEVAERLREVAESSLGEFVEDPEFEAAKNEQAFVEGRIRELELILANASLINSRKNTNGVVKIGSKVTIKEGRRTPEEYIIVGHAEADPRNGKISNESPLGKALLDKNEGDKVEIEAPDGSFSVKIVSVK